MTPIEDTSIGSWALEDRKRDPVQSIVLRELSSQGWNLVQKLGETTSNEMILELAIALRAVLIMRPMPFGAAESLPLRQLLARVVAIASDCVCQAPDHPLNESYLGELRLQVLELVVSVAKPYRQR